MDYPFRIILKRRHIIGTIGFQGTVFLQPSIEEWCEEASVPYRFDVIESDDANSIMWGPSKSPHSSVFSIKGYIPVIRFPDEKSLIMFKMRWC
jgi:hypothetical protein